MRISKELMEYLMLTSISVYLSNCDHLCFLERIENDIWTFNIPEKLESIDENSYADFSFNFESSLEKIRLRILESGENWFSVKYEKNDSEKITSFVNYIQKLQNKYESFGRRKEERIKIGKDKTSAFGLSKVEQYLFISSKQIIQPCVVLDVSIHGICVITPESPLIKDEDLFNIKLSFIKPEQTVILKAHKVYTRLNKTPSKTFMTLSCQLLEPIHFLWKERVISMMDLPLNLQ